MTYNLGRMLSPSPGKIILFAVLVFFLIMLPIYPVKMTITKSNYNYEKGAVTYSNEPLALIMLLGFEWEEYGYAHMEYSSSPNVKCGFYTTATIVCSADPGFLPVYGFLAALAYVFSCYLTHRANWNWRGRNTPFMRKN